MPVAERVNPARRQLILRCNSRRGMILGLALVLGEGVGGGEPRPGAVAFGAGQVPGVDRDETVIGGFDGDVGVGQQVVVPGGVVGSAALGGGDQAGVGTGADDGEGTHAIQGAARASMTEQDKTPAEAGAGHPGSDRHGHKTQPTTVRTTTSAEMCSTRPARLPGI
jgi:hypothetical protein